jgi:hypothetical protein
MKHSEVLSRYVNTGQRIPEKQFDRLTPVLKKSYLRMRGVAVNYSRWEFKVISDIQRINYIEKKSEKLDHIEIEDLLKYSVNKDDIATKIIEAKGDTLNNDGNSYYFLLDYSQNKDLISTKIIEAKGKKLDSNEIFYSLKYSVNKDDIATKIIRTKDENYKKIDISYLLQLSHNKEIIKKLLLQKGIDHKLINDVITNDDIDIPLIPDDYQSMLNEIRRIKEMML